eukprot:1836798-Alexandrium_andersonii.AAC.1
MWQACLRDDLALLRQASQKLTDMPCPDYDIEAWRHMISANPRQWKNIVKQAAVAIDKLIWARHGSGRVLGAASPRPPRTDP